MSAQGSGEQKPKRKKYRMVSIRFTPEELDVVMTAAKRRSMTMSEFIRRALEPKEACADCHAYGPHTRLAYTNVLGRTVHQSRRPFSVTTGALGLSFMGWLCRNCSMTRYGVFGA